MRWVALTGLVAITVSCGGSDNSQEKLLAEYRAAIPSESRVKALTPADVSPTNAVGDAQYPVFAQEGVTAINGAVVGLITTLKAITNTPPTMFDEAKQEFVWGPWDNDNGFGKVLVFIKKNRPEDDADFLYHYAFARMAPGDLNTIAPVIWGGATPDASGDADNGLGATLWDVEANYAFEQTHDPSFNAGANHGRGRFVAVYGSKDETNGHAKFNVAVFRNFEPGDGSTNGPVDLDYFFGHFEGNDGTNLTFLDWGASTDLCDADTGSGPQCFDDNVNTTDAAEDMSVRLAFINGGTGRAEVSISGGDLSSAVDAVECWDNDLSRNYVEYSYSGTTVSDPPGGNQSPCGVPFSTNFDTLGVPSLQSIDAQLLADMEQLALNGLSL